MHYCAESFVNDGSLPSLLMKTLKRDMAAEFSRELSVKVLAGQKRIACLGFKQGGVPGYGLRRMLVASDGTFKQLLANGERKSIATDRLTLVHGPDLEVAHVREMYRMLISDTPYTWVLLSFPFSNTVSRWPTCAELSPSHSSLPIVPDRRAEI